MITKLIKSFFLFIFLTVNVLAEDDSATIYYEKYHKKNINPAIIGIVERVVGPGYVLRKSKGNKATAALGIRLFEGDIIGSKVGRIQVRFKDGTFVELSENSEFQVDRLRYYKQKDDESVFRFIKGLVRIVSPNVIQKELYSVKTKTAILRVKENSEFYMLQTSDYTDLQVGVVRGQLDLFSSITNQTKTITQKLAAYLKPEGQITDTVMFDAPEANKLKEKVR